MLYRLLSLLKPVGPCFVAAVAASAALALSGCHSVPLSSAHAAALLSPAATPSRRQTVSPMERSSGLQRAARLFRRRDYAGALALIWRLEKTPRLSAEEHAYLSRQRAICEAALAGSRLTDHGRQTVAAPRRTAEQADCGPRALRLVLARMGVSATTAQLRRLAGTTGRGTTLAGLERAAEAEGCRAEGVQMDRTALSQLGSPAVAWVDGNHYLAVLAVQGGRATIHDPNKPDEEVIPTEELLRRSGGILLTVSR